MIETQDNTQDSKYLAIVERYINNDKAKKEAAGKKGFGDGHKRKLKKHLPISLKFFDEKGILSPSDDDFDMLKIFLKKQRDEKGNFPEDATVEDRVKLTRNFYKFYNRYNPKKGDSQMSVQDNTNTEAQASEVINPEVEISTHEQEAEAEINTAQETEDKAISGATKGRKPKPAEDRRSEKLNIYLTPTLYQDIKDLAYFSKREISDIYFSLSNEFVERNRKILEEYREFAKNAGTIQ